MSEFSQLRSLGGFGKFITVYNVLPEVGERMLQTLDQIVRKAAFDIEAKAKAKAPVDTGFLKSSIYVETAHGSTYGKAGGEGNGEMLPEVEPPKKYQAIVAVGASYGVFIEFGTSRMPAQPYLTPAAEEVRPEFEAALHLLEAHMTKVSAPHGGGSGGGA